MDRRCEAAGEGIAINTATRTLCPDSDVSSLISGCFSVEEVWISGSGIAGGKEDVTGGGRGEVGDDDRGLNALVIRDKNDLLGGSGVLT